MLIGERVVLRSVDISDAEIIRSWRNDPLIGKWFFSNDDISLSAQIKWIEGKLSKKDEVNFMVYLKDDPENIIGTLSLIDIDMRNRKAEYARLIIDPKYRGNGYSYEAELLILKYAFDYLNLNKIYCTVFCDNEKVKRLHKKTGFKEVGTFKRHVYMNGSYIDVIIYEIFKEERGRVE